MNATQPVYCRYMQIKTHINDIEANIKTKQQKPANAFRFDDDADTNEQEISELQELHRAYLGILVQYQSIYEID